MGRSESQKGQRLSLRCSFCKRILRIYCKKKTVSFPAKLVVINGSVHQTENKTTRIHIRCKCNKKMIFESKLPYISKYGWRRISQNKENAS